MRQPLPFGVGDESFWSQPDQTFFGTHPEISFAIFKQGLDPVEGHPLVVQLGKKAAFAKAVKAAVGPDPEIALAILADGAHEGIRKAKPHVVSEKVAPVSA